MSLIDKDRIIYKVENLVERKLIMPKEMVSKILSKHYNLSFRLIKI